MWWFVLVYHGESVQPLTISLLGNVPLEVDHFLQTVHSVGVSTDEFGKGEQSFDIGITHAHNNDT